MYDCSNSEIQEIDSKLESVMAWAQTRTVEAEQLALDAIRLLSCTADRLEDYKEKGFFKRCWFKLSGKHGEMLRVNQSDLIEIQKYALRYIQLLNERDMLMAQSIITIKNQLNSLLKEEENTRREITRLAEKVGERLNSIEEQIEALKEWREVG